MTEEKVLATEDAPPAFSVLETIRFGDLDAMQHLNNVQGCATSRLRASPT